MCKRVQLANALIELESTIHLVLRITEKEEKKKPAYDKKEVYEKKTTHEKKDKKDKKEKVGLSKESKPSKIN